LDNKKTGPSLTLLLAYDILFLTFFLRKHTNPIRLILKNSMSAIVDTRPIFNTTQLTPTTGNKLMRIIALKLLRYLANEQVDANSRLLHISYFLQNCKKGKPDEMDLPFLKTISQVLNPLLRCWIQSSSPGEFHPQALTEPDMNLSIHTAPVSHSLETSRLQADAERN
jgi:hypothetical protein